MIKLELDSLDILSRAVLSNLVASIYTDLVKLGDVMVGLRMEFSR